MCFEFLDGDFGTLWEEEDVPIFVSHGVDVVGGFGLWRWIEMGRNETRCDEVEVQTRLLAAFFKGLSLRRQLKGKG